VYTLTQGTVHTPHISQYAAITLTTSCTSSTYLLLTKCVIFSKVLIVAPWWWFPCKPKHVEAVLLILKCFNNSAFFNVVCVSWLLKCWGSLDIQHSLFKRLKPLLVQARFIEFTCSEFLDYNLNIITVTNFIFN